MNQPVRCDSASYLEINSKHLLDNINIFKKICVDANAKSPAKMGVVLKADAYGHGLLTVLEIIHGAVDMIFVIDPRDALRIRQFEGEKNLAERRVLVIGAVGFEDIKACAEQNIELTLADEGWAAHLVTLRSVKLNKKAKVHIHIDTGLSREGYIPSQMERKFAFLKTAGDVIDVVGAFSHFANTEDVTEQNYAQSQLDVFAEGVKVLENGFGFKNLERHFAASAAGLVLPPSRFDVLRVGISLYGFWPSPETKLSAKIVLGTLPQLHPVLSWRCKSQIVKLLPSGSYVGYGCTFRCSSELRIAVFPVGYYDGYSRALSARTYVLVNGVRCPVIGRIMMNHIVVDVTPATKDESPVTATLLGTDGSETISAEMLASWSQTIHYEFMARLGSHLRRYVVSG